MANPGCCCSLEKATRVIVVIELVLAILGVIFCIANGVTGIVAAINQDENVKVTVNGERQETNKTLAIGFAVLFFVIGLIIELIWLYFAWLLKQGSDNKDPSKLRVWFIANLIMSIICLILFGLWILLFIFILFPIVFYRIWSLWVVHSYRKELIEGPTPKATGVVYNQPA